MKSIPKPEFSHYISGFVDNGLITKSALINIYSVRIFVTIRVQTWQQQKVSNRDSWKCQNWNLHTSKIGYLLPACLRNNSCRANHMSELLENLVKIGKELRTQSFDNRTANRHTNTRTHTHRHLIASPMLWMHWIELINIVNVLQLWRTSVRTNVLRAHTVSSLCLRDWIQKLENHGRMRRFVSRLQR